MYIIFSVYSPSFLDGVLDASLRSIIYNHSYLQSIGSLARDAVRTKIDGHESLIVHVCSELCRRQS